MDLHATEEQQVEHIKRLWKKYGTSVISAVVLGLVLNFGLQAWRSHTADLRESASVAFERMMDDMANADVQSVEAQAAILIGKYESTPYASFAAMILAKYAVNENDLDKAKANLRWVIKHSKADDLIQIAKMRLARILLSEKDQAGALGILKKIESDAFLPGVHEIRGDIYLSQGNTVDARKAYDDAIATLPESDRLRPILKMKRDAIASADVENQAFVGIKK